MVILARCAGRDVPPEAVYRPTIVPQIIVDEPQVVMRDDLQADIAEGGCT